MQHAEFLRHIIRIHITVTGDEQAAAVGAHERKVAAPFIFDPDGVQIFRLRADHNHDLGRVQGSKDIRLVFLPELIFQRDAREEDLIARVGELVVNMSAGATTGTGKVIATLTGFMKKFWIKLSGMIQKSCGNNTQPN